MSIKETFSRRAQQLKTDIPAVFLAMKHKGTPWLAKVLAGVAVAYALSPVDLIPDFIPVVGYLDDLLILPALVVLIVKMVPPEVMAECRKKAAGMWTGDGPKKWYYALPILLVWALIIFLIVKAIVK